VQRAVIVFEGDSAQGVSHFAARLRQPEIDATGVEGLAQIREELSPCQIEARHRPEEEHDEPDGIRTRAQALEHALADVVHVEVHHGRLAAEHEHARRRFVLGVTLVLADGTVASAGGKVVKNVAGYDLARLVCGSRGRLALIARASFRLHPLPRATRTLVVRTDDPAGVVSTLRRSALEPSALDLLHPGRVAVLFEGAERAVEAQLARARALVSGEGAGLEVWDESRARQQAARGRVRFDPGRLADALAGLGEAVVRPAPGVAFTAEENASYKLSQALENAALDRLQHRLEQTLDPRGVLR